MNENQRAVEKLQNTLKIKERLTDVPPEIFCQLQEFLDQSIAIYSQSNQSYSLKQQVKKSQFQKRKIIIFRNGIIVLSNNVKSNTNLTSSSNNNSLSNNNLNNLNNLQNDQSNLNFHSFIDFMGSSIIQSFSKKKNNFTMIITTSLGSIHTLQFINEDENNRRFNEVQSLIQRFNSISSRLPTSSSPSPSSSSSSSQPPSKQPTENNNNNINNNNNNNNNESNQEESGGVLGKETMLRIRNAADAHIQKIVNQQLMNQIEEEKGSDHPIDLSSQSTSTHSSPIHTGENGSTSGSGSGSGLDEQSKNELSGEKVVEKVEEFKKAEKSGKPIKMVIASTRRTAILNTSDPSYPFNIHNKQNVNNTPLDDSSDIVITTDNNNINNINNDIDNQNGVNNNIENYVQNVYNNNDNKDNNKDNNNNNNNIDNNTNENNIIVNTIKQKYLEIVRQPTLKFHENITSSVGDLAESDITITPSVIDDLNSSDDEEITDELAAEFEPQSREFISTLSRPVALENNNNNYINNSTDSKEETSPSKSSYTIELLQILDSNNEITSDDMIDLCKEELEADERRKKLMEENRKIMEKRHSNTISSPHSPIISPSPSAPSLLTSASSPTFSSLSSNDKRNKSKRAGKKLFAGLGKKSQDI